MRKAKRFNGAPGRENKAPPMAERIAAITALMAANKWSSAQVQLHARRWGLTPYRVCQIASICRANLKALVEPEAVTMMWLNAMSRIELLADECHRLGDHRNAIIASTRLAALCQNILPVPSENQTPTSVLPAAQAFAVLLQKGWRPPIGVAGLPIPGSFELESEPKDEKEE